MKKKCRHSGKIKFESFEKAWLRAGEILNMHRTRSDALSAYRCPHCGKIHLTNPIKYEVRKALLELEAYKTATRTHPSPTLAKSK